MMKKLFLLISSLALLTACNDDESVGIMEEHTLTIENVNVLKDFVQSGAFFGEGNAEVNAPVVLPGQQINFKFHAGKGQFLMFATMYGASKDWFFAPENPGISLYDTFGNAMTGDVSSKIKLWDNGSKNDATGNPENNPISMLSEINAASLMKLSLDYNEVSSEFTLTITNTSGGTENETPFSPGVWVVSNILGGQLLNETPFYVEGQMSNPEITSIAESGNNEPLFMKVSQNTGIITGLSPALVVVYQGNVNPLFQLGQKDQGMGLKDLAQTGNVSVLKEYLESMGNNIKAVYMLGEAPIGPGGSKSIQIEISAEDKIAYATMFGYSNDWFYANSEGISAEMTGNITSQTKLFDNGTGINQFPGAGNNQALFGGIPMPENINIQEVSTNYTLPNVTDVIKISLN